MILKGKKIGWALTGSFCTIERVIPKIEKTIFLGAKVLPVISNTVGEYDTRFGKAEDLKKKIKEITEQPIITNIVEAEPLGPKNLVDMMAVIPCTGNTLAKLANGITDSGVTMACKAVLRNGKPVLLGIATNDGLSGSAKNIAQLLNTKNIYFVPYKQDDPYRKPNSLVMNFASIIPAIEHALVKKQIQPIIGDS